MSLIHGFFTIFFHCRTEENKRREQAKQQQKHQFQQMQRLSQSDNDAPQQPLFGVPKKVSLETKLSFQSKHQCEVMITLSL